MDLLVIPHAGGSCYSYGKLAQCFPEGIKLVVLDLPGHGKRIGEKLLVAAEDVIEDLFNQMKPFLNSPYAIIGHSLGGLLAFLLTHKIEIGKCNPPTRLFISACGAPSLITDRKRYLLESNQFWKVIEELGGLEPEFTSDRSFRGVFEPILRADFRIMEKFKYNGPLMISTPISIMLGDQDDISAENAALWSRESKQDFKIEWFKGDHFYLLKSENEVGQYIYKELQPLTATHDSRL